jgi:membrane-associated phospholipid phosphatase
MHVGWCLLISAGLYLSSTKLLVRGIAFVITPAMWFATVITGNHFFIDGVFGTILAGISLVIALWLQRNGPVLRAALRSRWQSFRKPPAPEPGSV